MTTFSLCRHLVSSLCLHVFVISLCVSTFFFLKDTSHIGWRLTLITSFYLNQFFKGPIFQIQPRPKVLAVRTSTYKFGAGTIQPLTVPHSPSLSILPRWESAFSFSGPLTAQQPWDCCCIAFERTPMRVTWSRLALTASRARRAHRCPLLLAYWEANGTCAAEHSGPPFYGASVRAVFHEGNKHCGLCIKQFGLLHQMFSRVIGNARNLVIGIACRLLSWRDGEHWSN